MEDLDGFFFLVDGCWRVMVVGDLDGESAGGAEEPGGEIILGVLGGGGRDGLVEKEGGDCSGVAVWNELNGECGRPSGATVAV